MSHRLCVVKNLTSTIQHYLQIKLIMFVKIFFRNSWTPALTVSKTMLSFLAFLMTPNADHALVPERAQLLKSNPDQYYEKVKEWTLKFATKKGTSM
jgi:ubiquitin-protein ligase